MPDIQNHETGLSRRNFLKGGVAAGAMVAAGASLFGCSSTGSAAQSAAEFKPDESYDVVVVGGGSAGQQIARTVTEAGLTCAVLEVMEPVVGPYVDKPLPDNASYRTEASHNIGGIGGDVQPHWTAEDCLKGVLGDTGPDGPVDFLTTICENAGEAYRLLTELGIKYRETSFDPDSGDPTGFVNDKMGAGILEALSNAAEAQGSVTQYGIRARSLVQDANGRVIGLVAEPADGGDEKTYGAEYAVVLACGGWLMNGELLKHFGNVKNMDHMWCNVGSFEQGDGFLMGMSVNAAPWFVGLGHEPHGTMTRDRVRFFEGSADDLVFSKTVSMGNLLVNKDGVRFVDESAANGAVICPAILQQPDFFSYCIYNDEMREKCGNSVAGGIDFGPITPDVPHYSGETLEDLGKAIAAGEPGFNVEQFLATVDAWNAAVDVGVDDRFRRKMPEAPISLRDSGPYYCSVTMAGSIVPGGGLRIDGKTGHVLNWPDLEPIPGLIATGGTAGVRGTKGAAKGFNAIKGIAGSIAFARTILDEAGVDWTPYVR